MEPAQLEKWRNEVISRLEVLKVRARRAWQSLSQSLPLDFKISG